MSARMRSLTVLVAIVVAAASQGFAGAAPAVAAVAPSPPVVVSPVASGLVTRVFVLTGRVAAGVSEVRVEGAHAVTVTLAPADSTGATFTARVTVHHGRTVLSITAGDGVTWSEPVTRTVWSLGTVSKKRFVLVDKSDFMLYAIRGSAVIASFPVATGMLGTPTPVRAFYLARPSRSPNSVWGPFRMRLWIRHHMRVAYTVHVGGHHVRRWKTVVRRIPTAFYIHGTNDPDSIGTRASHGCVRLWNSNLRTFSTLTYRYELTVIRN